MLDYFCLGLKYGAAVVGGLVTLAGAGFIAVALGAIVGLILERADDTCEGGDDE